MLVAKQRTIACGAFLVLTISACAAASRKDASSAGQSPQEQPPSGTSQAQQPQQQQGYPSSSPEKDSSPAKKEPAPPPVSPQTSGDYAKPPPNRAAAVSQASNEIESSQRELDVAGGDCRNACRALGSMDRAAGRLCGLAQSNDEVKKCEGAKTKVLSARDKVRNTCGTCPDVSVDRNAPVPSR